MYDYGNYGGYGSGADLDTMLGFVAPATLIFALLLSVFSIVCWWKIFVKAGKPGWGTIVPVYNTILMLDVAGMSWKWILTPFAALISLVFGAILVAVTQVNAIFIICYIVFLILLIAFYIIFLFVLPFNVAKSFGKGDGFAILTMFFPQICYAILAFDSSNYIYRNFSSSQLVSEPENITAGVKSVTSFYCPYCGSLVSGDSKYCCSCGSNIK